MISSSTRSQGVVGAHCSLRQMATQVIYVVSLQCASSSLLHFPPLLSLRRFCLNTAYELMIVTVMMNRQQPLTTLCETVLRNFARSASQRVTRKTSTRRRRNLWSRADDHRDGAFCNQSASSSIMDSFFLPLFSFRLADSDCSVRD